MPSITAWQAFSIAANVSGFMAPTSVLALAAASLTIAYRLDEAGIVIDQKAGDWKILEGPGGLNTVVGVCRNLLFTQQILFHTELLLSRSALDCSQANKSGKKYRNKSSHKYLQITKEATGPGSKPR